jgi:hypothetical protein
MGKPEEKLSDERLGHKQENNNKIFLDKLAVNF